MAATEDDLDAVRDEITARANEAGLLIIPAEMIGSGHIASIDSGRMEPIAVVDLAQKAGCRLLYLTALMFDADEELILDEVDDDEVTQDRVALRKRARKYAGQLCSLSVAFAVGPVLHQWELQAPWYENLVDLSEAAANKLEALEARALTSRYGEGKRQLEPDEQTRLARELAAMPAFRSCRGHLPSDRLRVALEHGELRAMSESDEWTRWTVDSVAREAGDLVAADAHRVYGELRQQMEVLAAELAADPAYQAANNVNLRRHAAENFLIRRSGGYRPTAVDRDLLLAGTPVPPKRKAGAGQAQIGIQGL